METASRPCHGSQERRLHVRILRIQQEDHPQRHASEGKPFRADREQDVQGDLLDSASRHSVRRTQKEVDNERPGGGHKAQRAADHRRPHFRKGRRQSQGRRNAGRDHRSVQAPDCKLLAHQDAASFLPDGSQKAADIPVRLCEQCDRIPDILGRFGDPSQERGRIVVPRGPQDRHAVHLPTFTLLCSGREIQ